MIWYQDDPEDSSSIYVSRKMSVLCTGGAGEVTLSAKTWEVGRLWAKLPAVSR